MLKKSVFWFLLFAGDVEEERAAKIQRLPLRHTGRACDQGPARVHRLQSRRRRQPPPLHVLWIWKIGLASNLKPVFIKNQASICFVISGAHISKVV
jgi:hypothetical protein